MESKAISNGWIDELEEEMNNEVPKMKPKTIPNQVPNKPQSDLELVTLKAAELGQKYRSLLAKDNGDQTIKYQISECERLIVELEELRLDLEKLGPEATIADVRKMKEEEAKEKSDGGFGPVKKLINPNVPKAAIEPEIPHREMPAKPDSFFKTFIYTAITCGILMSAYMFMLF